MKPTEDVKSAAAQLIKTIKDLLVLSVVCFIGYILLHKTSSASGTPFGAQDLSQDVTVPVGQSQWYRWTFTRPGRLEGYFTVQGLSAHLPLATDDTLGLVTLQGPSNEVLQKLDSPSSGNISAHCTGGIYTLTFDNSGPLRASSRKVTFKGTFTPD